MIAEKPKVTREKYVKKEVSRRLIFNLMIAGYTQSEVSKILDVSRSNINRISGGLK